MEVNPYSELMVWLIKWHVRNGMALDAATERAITIGAAISRKLIEPTALFNSYFKLAQNEEVRNGGHYC